MDEEVGVHLRLLEIENFKSYKGIVIVGPLRSFTAVIGPNGSGKSNFMDAISFVFGEQARSLRVKKLNELIHGSNINSPESTKCSVTAVLSRGEEEKRFQRIVKVSGNDAISDYRIDGKSVGNKQYVEALETYNIVIKPRNFLVFQGQVEQIATMSPKQRTVLLEKISGSGDLKDDFERLEQEQEAANEEMRKAFTKKKEMAVEEKEAKEDKKLADEYEKCQKDLDKEKSQLQLFELYHKDREMDEIKKEVRRQKQNSEQFEEEKHVCENGFKDAKKKMGETSREINQLEQQIRNAEVKVSQAKPDHISIKTKIEHLSSKIESEERMLNTLSATLTKSEETIEKLQSDKEAVEAAKRDFEESMTQTQQEVQSLTQLTPEQSAEYHSLKKEAARKLTELSQDLVKLKREYKKDKDTLSSDRQTFDEVTKELRQHRKERDQLTSRLDRLEDLKKKGQEDKAKLSAACEELEGSLEGLEEKTNTIQARLKEIRSNYADVRINERESARRAKKEELVKKLQQIYGDEVYGRLIDVCHHTHQTYRLPVTRILGKYMTAIIVSNSQIASQCIAYMKQQELEPETFIPLNNIDMKPLAEHLRRLDPKNVKLVYDVIQINHPDKLSVQKAVRFVCGNAVTCEEVDDARKLAYGEQHLHVVTHDGTLFDKGGTISGGAAELKEKAKRWDEKDVAKFKAEQTKLTEELRGLMKIRQKESELKTLKQQRDGMDARLKYAEKDRQEAKESLKETEKQIESLESKETMLAGRVKAAEEKVAKSEKKVLDVERQSNTVEDDVFRDFCTAIGVDNIRQYEAQEQSERQERDRKLLDFVNQVNKLGEQITYQKSKLSLLTEKVDKAQKSVNKLKKDLKAAKESEKQKEKELEKAESVLSEVKVKRATLQSTVEEREAEVEQQKKELAAVSKKLAVLTRQIQGEESKREALKLERRTILQYCKMNNVELPFEKGSMDDVGLALQSSDLTQSTQADSSQESSLNNSQSMEEKEAQIKLDYSKLPERLKRQLENADRNKEADRLQSRIKELEGNIEKLSLPKADAGERLGDIKTKARQTATELDKARELCIDLTNQFDRVKRERLKKFNDCLETISRSIDQIYKELVAEDSAEAFLQADNQDNPYNGGITFSLVVPGKNYRPIDSLSGGEKTLASLSLLFAIHAAHPSPFFIMDEVDAALDNTNILRVAQFMRKKSREEFQIIIISLKEEMYHHVDSLVGIYPEPGDVCISRNLTLDLNQYDRTRGNEKTKK